MNLTSRISLLCLAVTATFGTMIAAPAVKLLAVAFPDTNSLLIQWVVTLSSLFILPTLFMAGFLSRRFSRKNILIIGLLLYLIGGIGPAFSSSFSLILVFRAILGVSIGLISPTFNTLIAENFQGKERTRMMGSVTAINGIGGAIFLSIGGIIASYGWREVFFTYMYAVILLILVLLFLPKFPPIPTHEHGAKSSAKLPLFFYVVAIAGGIHAMLYFLIPTNLSLYLTDNGIGSVSTVGYLSALSLIGVFISGLVITPLTQLVRKMLVPLALMVMAVGFLLISMAHSVWTAAIAVFLIGFAEGLFYPITFNKTAEMVPKGSLMTAISLLLSCIYTFQFLSPLLMKGIQLIFHFSSNRDTFMLVAGALGLTMICYIPFTRTRKLQERQGEKIHSINLE
jgi:MFS family permease